MSQGDPLFKERAVDLGTRLMRAFETKNRLPYHKINLMTGEGIFKRISVGGSGQVRCWITEAGWSQVKQIVAPWGMNDAGIGHEVYRGILST